MTCGWLPRLRAAFWCCATEKWWKRGPRQNYSRHPRRTIRGLSLPLRSSSKLPPKASCRSKDMSKRRELADLPADIILSPPQVLAKAYRDYHRYHVTVKDGTDPVVQERDV